MASPKDENIARVIHNLKTLKNAKQNFWRAKAAKEKYGEMIPHRLESSDSELWSNYTQSTLKIVKDDFEKFDLYGYIISFGSGKWKSKKSIDTMIDGRYSPENDSLAIDEIIKELEIVKQNLSKTGSPEQPTETSGVKAEIPQGTGTNAGQKDTMSKSARALAVLQDHPDWTNPQIAKEAGVHPKSLSRMKNFRKAREILKASKLDIPKGSKDAETGDIEAWEK